MERLAHTHKDDVRQPFSLAVKLTREVNRLLDNLRSAQMPREPHLTGRAEHASHRAPRLRADACGAPVVVIRHQHRFDKLSVWQLIDALGRSVTAGALSGDMQHTERAGVAQLPAQRFRQVGHRLEVGRQLVIQPRPYLSRAKTRLLPACQQRVEFGTG